MIELPTAGLPTSKAEALRTGARFYFKEAQLCPAGHRSPRYTRGSRCVLCARIDSARRLGHEFKNGVRGLVSLERAAAAQSGATTYVGKPCRRGHTERYTASDNCVACNQAQLRRDREQRNWRRRERLYGIGREEFEALKARQDGRCGICREPLQATSTHVDHCHRSRQVRGLLCGPCYQAIGLFRENADIMRRAIAYVAD